MQFSEFNQVALTAADARGLTRTLADVYGLGPWLQVSFGDDGTDNFIKIDQFRLAGQALPPYGLLGDTATVGNMEYEVLQPNGGVSVNQEYLDRTGGKTGLQHLCLDDGARVDDIRAALDSLGLNREQEARVDEIELCYMRDVTQVLGIYLELHRRQADFRYPEIQPGFYPADNTADSLPAPAFGDTLGVSFVVSDPDRALAIFRDALGMTAWEDKAVICRQDREDYPLRRFVCRESNLFIELLCPQGTGGLYGSWLAEHGPGPVSVTMQQLATDQDLRARGETIGAGALRTLELDGEGRRLYDLTELLGLWIDLR